MKKRELKKRIENGFSELSPDLFEAVLEESSKQEVAWAETETEKPSEDGKFNIGRFPGYALSLCASMAIICLCIFGVLGTKERTVYMVLDINPSIQIEMNEAHQVKRLKGLNQDGKDVVKELKWKRKESVQELLDVLIQDVVEKSYLRENGGILVTLAAQDKCVCENLERTLGEGIDRKLTELKVSGVTTAFQEVTSSSQRQGRKLLEDELTKNCGLDESQVQQMSVIELIEYCRDYTSVELKLSEASEREQAARRKDGDKTEIQNAPSSENVDEQNSEDSALKETDSEKETDKAKQKKKKKKSSKKTSDGKQNSKDEQSEEGNTDSQKTEGPNSSVNLDKGAQVGESIPAGSEDTSSQTGTGEPPATEDPPGQSEGDGQSQDGGVLEQPDNSKTELENIPSQPGDGEKPKSEDDVGHIGNTKQPEVVSPGQAGLEVKDMSLYQESADTIEQ